MLDLPPQFIDMNGWLLMSSDRQEVPTALSLREQLLRADLRNLLDAYQEQLGSSLGFLLWRPPALRASL